MGGFLSALGQKIAERWLTLLALPGALFLAVAGAARILGHAHALDDGRLTEQITRWARTPAASTLGGQAVLLGTVLAAAAVTGLAAQGLGALVQRAVLGADWRTWPPPLRRWARIRVARRHARWTAAAERYRRQQDADANTLALHQHRADPTLRRAAHQAMLRIAAEEPDRPAWSGDRIHAAAVRLERDHRVDLSLLWPYLWLTLPETTRTDIVTAEQALTRATTLAGWTLLYAPLAVWWWPAVPLCVVLALTARYRIRSAADAYAQLLEAAARLHTTDLATQLGITPTGPLDAALGDALTRQLRPQVPHQPHPSRGTPPC